MNLDNFEFGPLDQDLVETFKYEFENNNIYEKIYQVKEGDVVVDIGASNGIFTYSILNKKPKHVFCLEPSKALFPYLVKNTIGHPVTQINKAVSSGNGITDASNHVYSDNGSMETIKFSTFVNRFGIDKIDFLKMDCETGEYDIFTDENISWLVENVGCIVGEWHLGRSKWLKEKFREFRDNYIPKFKNVTAYSVDGFDITWDLWNDNFINHYEQVILHLNNDTSRI